MVVTGPGRQRAAQKWAHRGKAAHGGEGTQRGKRAHREKVQVFQLCQY